MHVDAVVALAERASLFALRLPLHFVERLFPAQDPKDTFWAHTIHVSDNRSADAAAAACRVQATAAAVGWLVPRAAGNCD